MDMGYARVNLTYQGGLEQLREAFAGAGLTLSNRGGQWTLAKAAMIRHLPNLLSALRLLAAPFATWLILNNHDTAALLVFAGAGFSDGLDGFIARRWQVTSSFGAWLDPAADKLLMLFCFTALLMAGATPLWLVALVVARDAGVAAGWLLIKALGLPVAVQAAVPGQGFDHDADPLHSRGAAAAGL